MKEIFPRDNDEFKDRYDPKDGDFVVSGWKAFGTEAHWVAIVQEGLDNSFRHYCSHAGCIIGKHPDRCQIHFWVNQYCDGIHYTRLASAAERQILIDQLADHGLAWDPVQKRLAKL